MMPDELAFEFCQLDIGIVEVSCDFRTPVFLEKAEFLAEVHFFHNFLLILCWCLFLSYTAPDYKRKTAIRETFRMHLSDGAPSTPAIAYTYRPGAAERHGSVPHQGHTLWKLLRLISSR